MTTLPRQLFDFKELAANGLRRGVTTGSCAAAAVKAALLKLLGGRGCSQVVVNLVDGVHFVTFRILSIVEESPGRVRATVVKDAGDDPDVTHRAKIFAIVQANDQAKIRFIAGSGVGTITEPGFAYAAGEPAINPVPRQMMIAAVHEIFDEIGYSGEVGFDLEIGCENGAEISKKTYNARLGIVDGISILGTTGIVEPKSLSSFLASIELYIRIAIADRPQEIVFTPGNIGQRFAAQKLGFPLKRIVQMANFVGFSIDSLNQTLAEYEFVLPRLWLVGHPGKLAKLLDRVWDTHSKTSRTAVYAVCRAAECFGVAASLIEKCRQSTSIEQIIRLLEKETIGFYFWQEVENQIAEIVHEKTNRVQEVQVRLIAMQRTLLRGTL